MGYNGSTDVVVMDKLGYPQIEYIRKVDLTDDAIDRIAEAVAKKIENPCKNCQEYDCSWCWVKRQGER